HHGPRSRFLGDSLGVGMIAIDGEVELLQELNGVQILVTSVRIGYPLTLFATVVQIQHGRDRIYAQSVNVILLQPEQRAAAQKVAYFGAAIVENRAVPFRVISLAWIGVLIQMSTVEISQPVLIGREV